MYKLYFSQGSCSLATQVILHEINQPVELVSITKIPNYPEVNPLGTVPALEVNGKLLTEGAAIILYLLNQHTNSLLPINASNRQQVIEDMMFANATMHPAYSKLFFIEETLKDSGPKTEALKAAAAHIDKLWQQVEDKLARQPYLGGQAPSPADILLTVYASWGQFFPTEITIGPRCKAMIQKLTARPSFQKAVMEEQQAA